MGGTGIDRVVGIEGRCGRLDLGHIKHVVAITVQYDPENLCMPCIVLIE